MFAVRKMLGKAVLRQLSSLAEPLPRVTQGKYPVPNDSRFKKLMEKQTLFSREDGLLVWQKTTPDSVQYSAALAASLVGVLFTIHGIWKIISPPQNA